jgi:oligosaccharyltransferase complex subunit beta
MRWLLSLLLLGLAALTQAVSSSGEKLLVILEELADKPKYSKYFADLEGEASDLSSNW